jgi:hypothetical protein
VPNLASARGNALIIATICAAATVAALLLDRATGISAPHPPLAAAVVVAACFWWRPPIGLLAFGVFALLAGTIEHWLDLDLLLFDEVGLALLVMVAIAGRHIRIERIRGGWLEAFLGVLATAAVMSSLAAGVAPITWVAGVLLLFKGVAFFYLARWLRLSADDALQMGLVILLIAGVILVMGFIELLDPHAFQRALGLPVFELSRGEVPVIRSVFLHPALFGWLTAFASLLCYARFITHRTWWAAPLGLLFNVGTFLSGRRTPLLGVVAAIAAGLVWRSTRMGARRAAVRVWLPAAAIVLVLAAIAWPLLGRLSVITADEYGPSLSVAKEIFADHPRPEVVATIHPRVALYAASVAIARDHMPLGGGVGRFGSHLSRDDYSPLYARYGLDQVALLRPDDPQAATDAFWPMVLGESGPIGLIAALAFFAGVAVILWKRASRAASSHLRLILLAALFVFIESLVRSATSSVFVAPPIAYFALGAAGVALSAAETSEAAGGVQADDSSLRESAG